MKKLSLIVLSVVFLAAGSVWAKGGHGHCGCKWSEAKIQKKIDKKMKKMEKKYSLSADQKSQMEDILKRKMAKKKELYTNFKAEKKEAMKGFKDEIRGILNDDQKVKFDEYIEKKKKKHGKCKKCSGK